MPKALTAKHWRGNTPVVRVEVAVYWTIRQAAEALALVYADKPVMVGRPAVQSGINQAAAQRLLEKPGLEPDPDLASAYEVVINRHRERFVRYVHTADDQFRSAKWLKLPASEASHIRTDVAVYFSEDQAAEALALVHHDVPVARRERADGSVELVQDGGHLRGRMSCERGLQQAARERVLEHQSVGPAERDRVEFFRRLMRRVGMFPQP